MSDYAGQDQFHATVTVLDDNQQPSAANFALAVQGLADRTTYLHNRGIRGVDIVTSTVDGAAGGDGRAKVTGNPATWQNLPSGAGSPGWDLVPYITIEGCEVGDWLVVDLTISLLVDNDQTDGAGVRIVAYQAWDGASGLGPSAVDGTEDTAYPQSDSGLGGYRLNVSGAFQVTASGDVFFRVQVRNSTSTSAGVFQNRRLTLRVQRIRPNDPTVS